LVYPVTAVLRTAPKLPPATPDAGCGLHVGAVLRAKKGRRSVSWAGNRYGVGRGYTSRRPGLGQVAVWLTAAARVGACGQNARLRWIGRPATVPGVGVSGWAACHPRARCSQWVHRGDARRWQHTPPARADRASSMPDLMASACRAAYSSIT